LGDKSNQKVHVVGADSEIANYLRAQKFQVIPVKSLDEGEKLVREGKARLLLNLTPDADSAFESGTPKKIDAYVDPQQTTGQIAFGITEAALAEHNAKFASKVLQSKGIDPVSLAPISLDKHEIAVGKSNSSDLLISFLPYFIVIWAFYGGFGSAADLVAGEKEKMTLETLLITPVGRSQIAFGKFLSLATICFLSSFSALLGFIIAGVSGSNLFAGLFPHGLGFGAVQLLTILVVLLPTVAFFASMLIAVSAFAKNPREAQSYLALISFVVIMPAVFGQIIGFTDMASSLWVRFVPVLNTSLAVRESLQGKTNIEGIIITVLMGALLAFLGIRIAVSLFKREAVLTRI
jgi:sodium transport system permease protein